MYIYINGLEVLWILKKNNERKRSSSTWKPHQHVCLRCTFHSRTTFTACFSGCPFWDDFKMSWQTHTFRTPRTKAVEFHVKIWCHGVLHLYQCHIILVDHRLVTLYNETPTEVLSVLFLPVKWRHPPLFQATVKTYNFNRQWARHTELRLVLLCCRDGIELNVCLFVFRS